MFVKLLFRILQQALFTSIYIYHTAEQFGLLPQFVMITNLPRECTVVYHGFGDIQIMIGQWSFSVVGNLLFAEMFVAEIGALQVVLLKNPCRHSRIQR